MLPRPADAVVVEDLDDDVCLYRPDIDEVLVLNQSAGDIWRLSDGTRHIDEIAQALAAVYDQPADQLRADVAEIVDDLARRGYLVVDGSA